MSWSISVAGNPDDVVRKLQAHAATFGGETKLEYESALPHLVGLVNQNFGVGGRQIELTANGHGWDNYRNCTVTLREHDPLV